MDKKSAIPIPSEIDQRSHRSALPPLSKEFLFAYLFDPEQRARRHSNQRHNFGFTSPGNATMRSLFAAKSTTYLRIERVRAITGLATSTLYRLMKHAQFPRPMQLGPNCVGWREEEVIAWCKTRKPRNRPQRG